MLVLNALKRQPLVRKLAGKPPLRPSREALQARVNALNWVHTIDLGDGVVTPGQWGQGNPQIARAFDAIDFRGKRVLDIGCWDGKWAFEAERRGAALVWATDLNSQRTYALPTFELAHKTLRSKVLYNPHVSVYDVERTLRVRDFDVVVFCGIYYHLKDPVRALTCLRRVMREGGELIVEGAVLEPGVHYTPQPATGPMTSSADCFARFYYREQFCGDDSNWWVPTVPCLRQWVECSYLSVTQEFGLQWSGIENTRTTLIARAVRGHDPRHTFPDPDLSEYEAPGR